jgi:hypothetical protein
MITGHVNHHGLTYMTSLTDWSVCAAIAGPSCFVFVTGNPQVFLGPHAPTPAWNPYPHSWVGTVNIPMGYTTSHHHHISGLYHPHATSTTTDDVSSHDQEDGTDTNTPARRRSATVEARARERTGSGRTRYTYFFFSFWLMLTSLPLPTGETTWWGGLHLLATSQTFFDAQGGFSPSLLCRNFIFNVVGGCLPSSSHRTLIFDVARRGDHIGKLHHTVVTSHRTLTLWPFGQPYRMPPTARMAQ